MIESVDRLDGINAMKERVTTSHSTCFPSLSLVVIPLSPQAVSVPSIPEARLSMSLV